MEIVALQEKITQDDLVLYEILKHPVFFGEFYRNIDKTPWEEPFEYSDYQVDFLCDFNDYISFCCARAVGKTLSLTDIILWLMVNNIFPEDYINYHVPGKSHAEPVFTHLVRQLRTNSFLKNFIDAKKGVNNSDMIIKLNNGSSLLCRIAGQTGTGVAVIGLHTPFSIVDEAGYYPIGTWAELQPTINTFTPGYRLMVSGVPTGIREGNVLYHVDKESSSYTKHRVSALQNPRFSEEDRLRAIELYGGEESDDYIHLVLGQHGKPVFALFDRNHMKIEQYPVFKLVLEGTKLFDNLAEYVQKLSFLPGLPNKENQCIIGIDLGFTEPTAIVIWNLDKQGRIRIHSRITLSKVNYFIQEKIIDWLDSKFQPVVIGIDEGSAGKAVIPRLQEHTDFVHKNFKQRIIPVNFSSQINLGTDSEGNEIKSKTKPFAVSVLQSYTQEFKIEYSSTDLELITELERMTYTRTPSGDLVYRTLTDRGGKKGEDHFTSAMLCASMAYYLTQENFNFVAQRKKLAHPEWA